ncbi:JmjC domain-containing protein [Streptomyces sp. SCSIO 30461]|uniref:JmjC domain-containing protein n=1 Tax=Streptomyces sp. SCSIO 30461 TaxID=3118085 RepID=UPI00387E62DF
MADMHRVGALMREGCTMVLDEVDFFDPAMEATCRALQWWAHELVQVNAYLTTQDASGFKLHWDDHDVGTSGRWAWSAWTPCRLRTSSWSGPASS